MALDVAPVGRDKIAFTDALRLNFRFEEFHIFGLPSTRQFDLTIVEADNSSHRQL